MPVCASHLSWTRLKQAAAAAGNATNHPGCFLQRLVSFRAPTGALAEYLHNQASGLKSVVPRNVHEGSTCDRRSRASLNKVFQVVLYFAQCHEKTIRAWGLLFPPFDLQSPRPESLSEPLQKCYAEAHVFRKPDSVQSRG